MDTDGRPKRRSGEEVRFLPDLEGLRLLLTEHFHIFVVPEAVREDLATF